LVGPEREQIAGLQARAVSAGTVSAVLPEAAAAATQKRRDELAIALEPAVGTAVEKVVRDAPEWFGEILAPTIGAAVSKAVSAALAAMIERLNAALERSLSVRGLRWRVEARRTGRPFGEVVLLHTLKYRVEQVFLIHTNTSLVLEHAFDPALKAQAPDQVAAMLAAIDAFGREAFGPMPAEAHVEKFQLGELVVWVDRDPSLTIASVVRGVPGGDMPRKVSDVRTRIGLTYQRELVRFSGDVTAFAPTRPELESLLTSERVVAPPRAHLWLGALVVLVAAILGGSVWHSHTRATAESRERAQAVAALTREPGIVVTAAEWSGRRRHVSGLRDPLAAAPEAVVARAGLAPIQTDFTPFVSLDPTILQRRAVLALEPPAGVNVTTSEGTLHVRGVAPSAWIRDARLVARSIAGISRYDDSAVRSAETLADLDASSRELEAIVVPFETGQTRLRSEADGRVRRAADLARDAFALAAQAHLGACVDVVGHADLPGTSERNQALTNARAKVVAARLGSLGIDPRRIVSRGAGAWDAPTPRARSGMFRLRTTDPASACEGAS
jgi:OOP family OmpA-OmpF porin